ncbi:dihydroneopterin triphosphate diphosphatase [Arenicella sp.]|nr:dihydroneopterin triphosphate diphosphatase [Arenicella sp.]
MDPRHFKRPESVLVVVHTDTEVLLIKRVDHADFWQSVTGSLEWGEVAKTAAARELAEETGIRDVLLRDTGVRRSYKIIEAWQPRYHPNSTRNHESLFYCYLNSRRDITLSPDEHSEYQWLPFMQAKDRVYSWSNRLAIESLI